MELLLEKQPPSTSRTIVILNPDFIVVAQRSFINNSFIAVEYEHRRGTPGSRQAGEQGAGWTWQICHGSASDE